MCSSWLMMTSVCTAGEVPKSRIFGLFRRRFPLGAQTIRLEQNYRSTHNILKAANALIAHNAGRLGKNLWTADGDGEPIQLYQAFNETDEARFVVERIRQWVEAGGQRRDAAILYRSNAQSRLFEETLIAAALSYRIYGGLRFFERAEIKDALAYLRLVAHRDDDPSFERVVNTPPRAIGERTVDLLREAARVQGGSLAGRAGPVDDRWTERSSRQRGAWFPQFGRGAGS